MLPLLVTLLAIHADPAPKTMDIVIRDVTLFDGSGNPGVKGSIALAGERIVAVGTFEIVGKPRIIDGTGLMVTPGFIDLHTHCDTGSPSLTDAAGKANKCYLMQGVTLTVTGNCGFGPAEVKPFFETLEKNGVGTNVIHQVPHNSIRSKVMGNANREPTSEELGKMEKLVDEEMAAGCWGFATGLIYTPGTYSKTPELIALAKVAAKHQGFYASHIRNESATHLEAIAEIIKIGKEGGLPVHISHIKCSGKSAWGNAGRAVALIENARHNGQVVTADQYPYIASSTSLTATVIPTRFREGTTKEYVARLDDAEIGPQIRKAIEAELKSRDKGQRIQVARYKPRPKWQGKTIAAIAGEEKKDPIDIVLEIERNGGASIVHFGMDEVDVRIYMKQEFVATASDGNSQVPGDTVPHPRSYGTFPRKIGLYAIENRIVPVEQAIRSASGLPADILRITDRGYLKPGYFADVVVFDPKTYRDHATFEKPHQYSTGVKYLFVNGKMVIDDSKYLDVLAGKPLRHVEMKK
ncbi:MAG: D-aminoacylase [Planctomycetes bacterium]|nr:D-aminoacylase [Planctomycetota bacterium]